MATFLFTFSVHPLATLKIHFYIITMWHKLRQGWYHLKKPFLMCLDAINESFLCLTLVYVCVSHKANLELHYIWQQSPKISTFSEMIELSWQKKHPNPNPQTLRPDERCTRASFSGPKQCSQSTLAHMISKTTKSWKALTHTDVTPLVTCRLLCE